MTITRRDTLKYTGAAIAVMSGSRAASAETRAESNALCGPIRADARALCAEARLCGRTFRTGPLPRHR